METNGVNHHYLEWGAADKPSVLMFHAVGMCAGIWNHAARDLALDHHVYSFDLRGHGDTEHLDGEYTFMQIGHDTASGFRTGGVDMYRPFRGRYVPVDS